MLEAHEYLERTSAVLLKIYNTEIQNADVREGLVVQMGGAKIAGTAADAIDADFDLDEPFQPPQEKTVFNANETIGFGNMTMGGP